MDGERGEDKDGLTVMKQHRMSDITRLHLLAFLDIDIWPFVF